MRTLLFIAAALVISQLVLPSALSALLPTRWWIEVRGVVVEDGQVGGELRVIPDRTIHRPFRGEWVAYVRKAEPTGFTAFCRRSSPEPFIYDPGNQVPPDSDMSWWLEIPPNADCPWQPGQYRMTTEWRVHLWFGVTLRTSVESNVFTIHPPVPG
jgi:hypothetical protein